MVVVHATLALMAPHALPVVVQSLTQLELHLVLPRLGQGGDAIRDSAGSGCAWVTRVLLPRPPRPRRPRAPRPVRSISVDGSKQHQSTPTISNLTRVNLRDRFVEEVLFFHQADC